MKEERKRMKKDERLIKGKGGGKEEREVEEVKGREY